MADRRTKAADASPKASKPPAKSPAPAPDPVAVEVLRLVAGEHGDPHHVLGAHSDGGGRVVVRAYRPDAEAITVVCDDGTRIPTKRIHDAGVFEARIDT